LIAGIVLQTATANCLRQWNFGKTWCFSEENVIPVCQKLRVTEIPVCQKLRV
jgi:hypothetical protein